MFRNAKSNYEVGLQPRHRFWRSCSHEQKILRCLEVAASRSAGLRLDQKQGGTGSTWLLRGSRSCCFPAACLLTALAPALRLSRCKLGWWTPEHLIKPPMVTERCVDDHHIKLQLGMCTENTDLSNMSFSFGCWWCFPVLFWNLGFLFIYLFYLFFLFISLLSLPLCTSTFLHLSMLCYFSQEQFGHR